MKRMLGFTLLEIMIAMFIGVMLLAGVIATYIGMKATTNDTMQIGELQEKGRLALSIMRRDIEQVGFWGTFYDKGFTATNQNAPANPGNDCSGGPNNGSFPNNDPTNFRPIWATVTNGASALGCISRAVPQSEVLQMKFLEGNPVGITGLVPNAGEVQKTRYYFIAQQEQAEFIAGNSIVDMPSVNATLWPYSHHVYYVSEEEQVINNRTITVPVLRRKRLLISGGMVDELVIEGVEQIRFVFGLDTDYDGRVDRYRHTANMSEADWSGTRGILSLQLFVLVRVLQPDADFGVQKRTYYLGNDPARRELTYTDAVRRTVFSTTISMYNMGGSAWEM
ncbi:PilW family protein [Pseudoalteromonas sp. L23]|uniref:PilW family protein n=1 Tax=unclassified Pseudoalteromonas TaxID=194690 RepID=UPI001F40E458|nr:MULTISPECIES: PilW family protein [unclassified Pseudoalteromonas]MCF2825456.1 PilW family protein [Pseudoalteromonas sp. OF5H-5]MCF2832486.1 PilW family protein [Pseudoalteromonas sp. DL2-H6]MCF2923165.1 PilW family protein [Pseudoalteromonas sp. DL2-H1]MCF7512563.1 PilW family protein [Pseudoalteromonas sp. L7]MCF7524223.1 PilW family protein [Pseudoalteromonas sp. L23]